MKMENKVKNIKIPDCQNNSIIQSKYSNERDN